MPEPLIMFDHISKTFGEKKVIKDLSLSIHPREIFGIVGKSGAGKSTLIKMLIGFYRVDSGKILFHNKDITKNPRLIKQVVGFCTQDNSFYPELTVEENLFYYGRLYGLSSSEITKRSSELLDQMGIFSSKDALASSLSGGMKRRLDFSIALIHHPHLLILDEPTTGLDPITEKRIWDLISDLASRGISILVISHMLDFVEKYCNTIGFLAAGQIVAIGTPSHFRKKYSHKETFAAIFEAVLEGH